MKVDIVQYPNYIQPTHQDWGKNSGASAGNGSYLHSPVASDNLTGSTDASSLLIGGAEHLMW